MIHNHEKINPTVYKILKFVDENISCRLTVSRVAEEFLYSVSYISHLFKKETGVSLQSYIISKKIDYAKSLLSDKNVMLIEVAAKCGYKSVPSFCRLFRKYTGFTPSQRKNSPIQYENNQKGA